MDLRKEFNTDPDLEVNGTWVPIGEDGLEFLIARAGNKKFEQAMEKLLKEHRSRHRILRGEEITPEVRDKLTIWAMADAIWLGWRGPFTEGDSDLVYSKAEARRLLEIYRDLRLIVQDESMRIENFRRQVMEEAEKN